MFAELGAVQASKPWPVSLVGLTTPGLAAKAAFAAFARPTFTVRGVAGGS
jgi:hypothetical protein